VCGVRLGRPLPEQVAPPLGTELRPLGERWPVVGRPAPMRQPVEAVANPPEQLKDPRPRDSCAPRTAARMPILLDAQSTVRSFRELNSGFRLLAASDQFLTGLSDAARLGQVL
jgi:hypothetical protein